MSNAYRVRLADGQVFDKHRTPEQIRQEHPGAVIEGRIALDAHGIGYVVPFQGEQPVEKTERLEQEQQAPDYGSMTVAQLHAELGSRGIEYPGDAKKVDLVLLLQESDLGVLETVE